MDFRHYLLQSLTDPTWINEYAAKMGEQALYAYKNEVYKALYNLQFGESIVIEKWVKPENYDLFVKICCCFISESEGCYQFNVECNKITHKFKKFEPDKFKKS